MEREERFYSEYLFFNNPENIELGTISLKSSRRTFIQHFYIQKIIIQQLGQLTIDNQIT